MNTAEATRFIILISGRGSNMEALLKARQSGQLHAEPALVISNRSHAPGLAIARAAHVRTEFVSFRDVAAGEARVLELAHEVGAAFIVLAGFMRVLTRGIIDHFPHRIINIHPSLLPAFPGLHAQEQALAYGVRISGCTTHFVNAGVDTGPIIQQRVVPVHADDTAETLAARILDQEHALLVETVNFMAQDRLRVQGRKIEIRSVEE